MDLYEMGNDIPELFEGYIEGKRRTGRTTLLMETLTKDDAVLCLSHMMRNHLAADMEFKEVDFPVSNIYVVPNLNRIKDHCLRINRRIEGKLYLDHTLVEHIYRKAIEDAAKFIDYLEL